LRLMLGFAPLRVGDALLTAIKFGVVLSLATNWPAYQRVVLDVLFHGPEQLCAQLLGQLNHTGFGKSHDVMGGLQQAYDRMQAAMSTVRQAGAAHISDAPDISSVALSLTISSWVILFANLGLILAAKIILGLLTALGPLFAGLLLFEAGRGLFEGWLRAVLAFSLMPLVVTLGLVLQLTLLEPHLRALSNPLPNEVPNISDTTAILVLCIVSAFVVLAASGAALLIAKGLKFGRPLCQAFQPQFGYPPAVASADLVSQASANRRILAIATAALQRDRRETRLPAMPSGLLASADLESPTSDITATIRLHRPQTRPRMTRSGVRRDS
jgi:type IV secretion system protein VirB6